MNASAEEAKLNERVTPHFVSFTDTLATRQAVSQFRVVPVKQGGVYALAYDIMTGACFCGGADGLVSKWMRKREAPSPTKKGNKQTWREKSLRQTHAWQRTQVVWALDCMFTCSFCRLYVRKFVEMLFLFT